MRKITIFSLLLILVGLSKSYSQPVTYLYDDDVWNPMQLTPPPGSESFMFNQFFPSKFDYPLRIDQVSFKSPSNEEYDVYIYRSKPGNPQMYPFPRLACRSKNTVLTTFGWNFSHVRSIYGGPCKLHKAAGSILVGIVGRSMHHGYSFDTTSSANESWTAFNDPGQVGNQPVFPMSTVKRIFPGFWPIPGNLMIRAHGYIKPPIISLNTTAEEEVIFGDEHSLRLEDLEEGSSVKIGEPYPNPFNPTTSISLLLREAQEIQVQVFDVMGRLVSSPFSGRLEAGTEHAIQISLPSQPTGRYLVSVQGQDWSDEKFISLLK